MPFAGTVASIVSPTGSFSVAIVATPSAIAATRSGVSFSRSSNALDSPAVVALATSIALAERIWGVATRIASAIAASPRRLSLVDKRASMFAAMRALRPSAATSAAGSISRSTIVATSGR